MSATDRHSPAGEKWITTGGAQTATLATGISTQAAIVKAEGGRLCRVLVTSAGSANLLLYDSASAASGTVIGVIPSGAAAGTVYSFDTPAAWGIVAATAYGSPACTVSYY